MGATSVSEIKKRPSAKEIESPRTGIRYRIRKFSQLEFEDLGVSAIMTVDINTLKGKTVQATADSKTMLSTAQTVIERGVLEPPISFDTAAIDDPERVHVSEIAEDDLWLFQEIMAFSGISSEAKADVKAFAGNGPGPESSTRSPEDTVDSHTSS